MEFPPPENDLRQIASEKALIAGIPEMPIIETFKVNSVTYSLHRKRDKPPSLKVHYSCCGGMREFHEYVCVQHEGFAKVNARRWWEKRTSAPFPTSVEEALLATPYVAKPTSITVHVNLDHPKVLSHEFGNPN
jgi:DNA repair protein RadD